MSNLQSLLNQLREWSGEQPDNAGRVATILMGLFAPAAHLKIADAPAHPAAMRDWLVRTITAFADDGRWPDPPLVGIQADKLLRFLPLVLTHTEVADWPPSPSLRRFRAALSYAKASEGIAEAFRDDPLFRKFLGQFGGVSVAAPDWGKYRAQYTVGGAWRWPLAIVVDERLLAHPLWRAPARSSTPWAWCVSSRTANIPAAPYAWPAAPRVRSCARSGRTRRKPTAMCSAPAGSRRRATSRKSRTGPAAAAPPCWTGPPPPSPASWSRP